MPTLNKPIGIFGGTFDPIHLGHLHLAAEVLQKAQLEKINLVPCYQSPLRTQPRATPDQRLMMVKLAIAKKQNLFADDQEIERKGISYTIDTLEFTRATFKTSEQPLVLIMGIDAFNQFDHWHKWQNILELAHLVVVNRPKIQFEQKEEIKYLLKQKQIFNPQELTTKPGGNILILDIHPLPISATNIRNLLEIKHYNEVQNMLPENVWQYILKNNIYK